MDKYEKARVVGRGAFGTVHLCKRLSDKKMVIIKQIPVEQLSKDERQAVLNEVKVLAMLDHPNIIEYYHNFLEDKALMIVMEYAEGGTLFDFIQDRNGQLLEEENILRYFAQMLLSLQHVHSKQILHRDLKTQNILLDKKLEIIKIGDFGISKILSSKSKAFTVVGTPCYISPELCEGKPYNQKSDIWALGCVLYELVTLRRAFEAQNLPALILKIMRGTVAPIDERYSDDLRSLMLDMLHLDPNRRPCITNIMAMPVILNPLMYLHCDFGKVPCRRSFPGMPASQGKSQNQGSSTGRGPGSQTSDPGDHHHQSVSLCHVYCWGGGINTPTRLPLPSSETIVTQVACGRTQRAAVTKNGRMFIWEPPSLAGGSTDRAELFIPRYLEGQTAVLIQHVSCGDLFTACLTDRGILMTFGSGANGCLGHGNLQDVSQAKIVEALLGFEITDVSCGASHVLAVTNDYEVFAWGRAENGRLGLEATQTVTVPTEVKLSGQHRPVKVYCGADCSFVLTLEGKLQSTGSNRFNKLALDTPSTTIDSTDTFRTVCSPPLHHMVIHGVAVGTSHTIVINSQYECYTFGANTFGQLGHGLDAQSSTMPHRVQQLADKQVTMAACGDTFTVAITKDSEVFTWGKGSRGRLGRTDEDDRTPHQVHFDQQEQDVLVVTAVSSSHGNTLLATKTTSKSSSLPRSQLKS